MKHPFWIRIFRIAMLAAWVAIMYFGTTAYHALYSFYAPEKQTPVELWVRSGFSSIQLFAFNIDSNAVDGWKESAAEADSNGKNVDTYPIEKLHYTAVCAGIWTIFFVVLLLFKTSILWTVRHGYSFWFRRDLYIFWGINRRSIQLAHELSRSVGWRNILFVAQPDANQKEAEGLKQILHRSRHRNALKEQIGTSRAAVMVAERPVTAYEKISFRTWSRMGMGLMMRYILLTFGRVHVLLLGDNETVNIYDALKLSDMSLWPFKKPEKVTIHCHARRGNINRIIEDVAVHRNIKVIDSSHLAIELLKKDVDNHPVRFVELSTQNPGTVASPFRCMIVGFSECGQDALRFLYEFGAFVDESNRTFEEDKRSPFLCDIVDREMPPAAVRWKNHAPDVFEKVVFHPVDYTSPEFYTEVLDKALPGLNYLVIAVGDDRAGITLAADIMRYAIKTKRVRYTRRDNRFRIYVRSYDPNMHDFMEQVADYYNQNHPDVFIRIFGAEQDIYTKGVLIDDELLRRKESYERNYQLYSERLMKTHAPADAAPQPADPETEAEKNTRIYRDWNKNRKDSQNFSNALHLETKRYIKANSPAKVPPVRLAQTEHLRWWAAHEIMGYRCENPQNEKQDIMHFVHNCMKPWSELNGETKIYDFITFNELYQGEESELLANAIEESRNS